MSVFKGKVAIVTGGGSGLGEAISKELAAKGASVVVSDINLPGAQRVVDEIVAAGGVASAIEADTANPDDSAKVVKYAVDTYGALHLAVNNAGIGGPAAPAGETDLAAWDKVIAINLSGVLYGMRYQIPAMLAAGDGCAIVNMASIHGMVAAPGNGAYTAAKHGVVGITKNTAAEYGALRLRTQLRRARLHHDAAAHQQPDRRHPRDPQDQALARTSRAPRGGLPPRVLPPVGRGVVHHGQLSPGRRWVNRGLTGVVGRSSVRSRVPMARSWLVVGMTTA